MAFLIGGANTLSGAYTIDNSLRFNDDDDPSLYRSNDSGGSDTKATISFWMKRGHGSKMFYARSDNSNNAVITISGSPEYRLESRSYNSGNLELSVKCALSMKDESAWYHIVMVWDTTDGTAADRAKMYVNGERVTNFREYTTQFSSNDTIEWFQSDATFYISGEWEDGTISGAWDGYMADVYVIDGTAYQASTFGETDEDSGIWKPKSASPTFGTNGFKLEFKQTGTGTASASTLGADTSGNDNHLTSSNLAATDQTTDTPTNNFATMNPLDNFHSECIFSEGNCKFVTNDTSNAYPTATIGDLKQGKWYLEVKYTDPEHTDDGDAAGEFYGEIAAIGHKLSDGVSETDTSTDLYASSYLHNFAYSANNGRIKNNNTAGTVHGSQISTDGQIIGFLLDLDNNRVTTHKDGQYADGSGNHDESFGNAAFVSITAPASTPLGGYFIGFNAGVSSSESGNQNTGTYEINFGNPSFSISSGNADANGYGNFEYAVPSGYYALCTKNLAEFG